MTIDRATFFAQVRGSPFRGNLNQSQVDGMGSILSAWETAGWMQKVPDGSNPVLWLSYMLATAYHETAQTMQPIKEFGYGRGRAYGVKDPATGQVYYGRGLVQLTWKANYQKFGVILGIDLLNQPDKALEGPTASAIMFLGMMQGLFTGVGLAKYFNATTNDPVNARRIVNGLDCAALIATYHRSFATAIGAAQAASDANGGKPA